MYGISSEYINNTYIHLKKHEEKLKDYTEKHIEHYVYRSIKNNYLHIIKAANYKHIHSKVNDYTEEAYLYYYINKGLTDEEDYEEQQIERKKKAKQLLKEVDYFIFNSDLFTEQDLMIYYGRIYYMMSYEKIGEVLDESRVRFLKDRFRRLKILINKNFKL